MEFNYEATAIVDAPPSVVFSDWASAVKLPHLLTHVRATAQADADDLARLVVMIDGHHVEFAAERTMCCESSICWQSLGEEFYYVLSLTIEKIDMGRCTITAHVTYDPPGFLYDLFETLGLSRGLGNCLAEDLSRYGASFHASSMMVAATALN